MTTNAIKLAVVGVALTSTSTNAQYSLTSSSYSQDFNKLPSSGTITVSSGALGLHDNALTGWYFYESGTNANSILTAGTGSSNTGDTYSFGSTADRALGGLQSGNLIPSYGFYFVNNTGGAIRSLNIIYTGETWRVGSASRSDRLDFQYSTDASSLSTGNWTDFDTLDYANSGQAMGSGSLQHSASISATLVLSTPLLTGSQFFIRWNDFNASGADDGMGVDDFSFTVEEAAQYWDANGTAAGVGGTGNWPDPNRWSSSLAGTDAGDYNKDLRAVFAGTPGIVTMTANRTNTVGLRFEVDGYLINSPDGYALTITSSPKFEVTDGAHTATISAPISGTGSFEKAGEGTLVLSGTNDYTGTTTINGGKLVVNGSHTGPGGGYTVNTGGTLGGTGTISRSVTVNTGGTLAPGNSIESLDVGSLTLSTGSTFEVEVNVADSASNVAGVDNDVLNVATSGSVALGGTLKVVLLNVASSDGVPGTSGLTYTIINNQSSGSVSGVFNSVVFVNAPGPVVYSWSSTGGDGNDVVLTISQIPEPASLSLLAVGALALRRRR